MYCQIKTANIKINQNFSGNDQPGDSPTNQSMRSIRYEQIAFLSTYKAGSSTAQNIFLRYGYSRNLFLILQTA